MMQSNLHLHLRMVRKITITLMRNCMKNRFAHFAMTLFFSGLITTLSYAQSALIGNIDEANRLISIHDCVGAEVYARNNFQRPMVNTIFGMIQLDCAMRWRWHSCPRCLSSSSYSLDILPLFFPASTTSL
jgi:hypothetical protein